MMPIPKLGPTSSQFMPRIPPAVADAAITPVAVTGNFPSMLPVITYTVCEGDSLADVTRRLYGSNTKHYRFMVRNQGFYPGSTLTAAYHPSLDRS